MSAKGKILVVDDEAHQRTVLCEAAKDLGYEAAAAESGQKALELIRFGKYDVVITDLMMPGMTGLQVLERARVHDPTVSVLVATAHGTIETAVEAMRQGAEDYLQKPVEFEALDLVLQRIFRKRELVRENQRLRNENDVLKRELGIRYHVAGSIGRSEAAQKLVDRIERAMKTRVPIALLGPTGCGHEDYARMIHYNGPWAESPLILFDCASVPGELHEAHLFGEEEALEGGVRTPTRPGLVEKAHLGTLVVFAVHRLADVCQARLARATTDQKTQRSGGSRFYPANIRLVATSEKDEFDRAFTERRLRRELRYLLIENKILIPSLRERAEDIPVLLAVAAKRAGQAQGKDIQKVNRTVVERLEHYDFPGDLKELTALVEAAVARCDGPELHVEHFGFERLAR